MGGLPGQFGLQSCHLSGQHRAGPLQIRQGALPGQTLGCQAGLVVDVVICEGIETEAQADLIRSFGCELFQGYLFDKAIPIDVLAKKYLSTCNQQVA
jgi:c-di-GMP-related signal transduction protein